MKEKGLTNFVLGEFQLLMLIFPFTSFFTLFKLEFLGGLTYTLNVVLSFFSLAYLIKKKATIEFADNRALMLTIALFCFSFLWVDGPMFNLSALSIVRCVLVLLQIFVVVQVLQKDFSLLQILKNQMVTICLVNFVLLILLPRPMVLNALGDRVQGIFSSPNNLGQFVSVTFLLVCFYNGSQWNRFTFVLILSLLYQIYLSDSMTSFVGAILIFSLERFDLRRKYIFNFFIILGVMLPLVVGLGDFSSGDKIGAINRDLTFTGRSEIWRLIFVDLVQFGKLFWGFGAGGYWDNNPDVVSRLNIRTVFNEDIQQSHNGYVEIILIIGIFGLTLFLTFLHRLTREVMKLPAQLRAVPCIVLFIIINNITEASYFKEKNVMFVIIMLCYWVSIDFNKKILRNS